eukprot:gene12230-biopygen7298
MGRPRSPLGVDESQWWGARRPHVRPRGGQGRRWGSTNPNGVERAALMCAHEAARVALGGRRIPMVWSAPPSCAPTGRPMSPLGVDESQWCGARRPHVRPWGGQGRPWESANPNGVERAALMCAHWAAKIALGGRRIPMVWSAPPSCAPMGRPRSPLGFDESQWCGARRRHVRSGGGQGRPWGSTNPNGGERAALMCAHGAAKVAVGGRRIPMVWSAPPSCAPMGRPRSPLGVDESQWCGARRPHVRSWGGQGRPRGSTNPNGVERAALLCAHGAANVAVGGRRIPMMWSAPPSCAPTGRPRSPLGVDESQWCGARRPHVRSLGGQDRPWGSTNPNGVERAALMCAHGAAKVALRGRRIPMVWRAPPSCAPAAHPSPSRIHRRPASIAYWESPPPPWSALCAYWESPPPPWSALCAYWDSPPPPWSAPCAYWESGAARAPAPPSSFTSGAARGPAHPNSANSPSAV